MVVFVVPCVVYAFFVVFVVFVVFAVFVVFFAVFVVVFFVFVVFVVFVVFLVFVPRLVIVFVATIVTIVTIVAVVVSIKTTTITHILPYATTSRVASKTCSGTHTLNIVAHVNLHALSWDSGLKGTGEAYCCYVQIYCPMVVLQSIGTTAILNTPLC